MANRYIVLCITVDNFGLRFQRGLGNSVAARAGGACLSPSYGRVFETCRTCFFSALFLPSGGEAMFCYRRKAGTIDLCGLPRQTTLGVDDSKMLENSAD